MEHMPAMALKKRLFAGTLAALLVVSILPGCNPVFMSKDMFVDAQVGLPAKLEENFCPITSPLSALTKAPATVIDPDRPPRFLTLQEAFAEALENGSVSSRAGAGLGEVDDTLASQGFGSQSLNSQSERIRVLSMNPAIANAAMEGALARFDVLAGMGINWANTDNLQQGLSSFNNGNSANVLGYFIKPLPTGGVASMTMLVGYQNLNAPPTGVFGILNPQYTNRLSIGLEQPLWRDWGVEMNQLLTRLPAFSGLSLNPNANAAAAGFNTRQGLLQNNEGILISRLRFDQQRAELERLVNILIVNVEVAYWNLYARYGALYSAEENLRIMHKTWQENYDRFKAGSLPPQSYSQILGQYEEFRGDRVKALNDVLDAERKLRGILGLLVEDGKRLIPITPPVLAELRPDWESSVQDALNLRPEMQLARDNLRYHQYLLSIQKNYLKPDLRAFVRYEPVGFGNTLTGNGTFIDGGGATRPTNSFQSLTNGSFNDYTFGVNLNMPLGFRYELAAVRQARLQLTQSYLFLRDQEDKATRFLAKQHQDLAHWYKRIETHRAERLAYRESLQKRLDQIKAGSLNFGGNEKEGPLAFLESQRRYGAALIKEYNAIAEYNSSLARYEWARGTILRYNNIHIGEGALPHGVQVGAVEYEKERSKALILRERPDSLHQPGRLCATSESEIPRPTLLPLVEVPTAPLPTMESKQGESQPVPLPLLDKTWSPQPSADVLPIQFKSAKPPISEPRRLPPLESSPAPLPLLLKEGPNTSALPPVTGGNLMARQPSAGSVGIVTMEELPLVAQVQTANKVTASAP